MHPSPEIETLSKLFIVHFYTHATNLHFIFALFHYKTERWQTCTRTQALIDGQSGQTGSRWANRWVCGAHQEWRWQGRKWAWSDTWLALSLGASHTRQWLYPKKERDRDVQKMSIKRSISFHSSKILFACQVQFRRQWISSGSEINLDDGVDPKWNE